MCFFLDCGVDLFDRRIMQDVPFKNVRALSALKTTFLEFLGYLLNLMRPSVNFMRKFALKVEICRQT